MYARRFFFASALSQEGQPNTAGHILVFVLPLHRITVVVPGLGTVVEHKPAVLAGPELGVLVLAERHSRTAESADELAVQAAGGMLVVVLVCADMQVAHRVLAGVCGLGLVVDVHTQQGPEHDVLGVDFVVDRWVADGMLDLDVQLVAAPCRQGLVHMWPLGDPSYPLGGERRGLHLHNFLGNTSGHTGRCCWALSAPGACSSNH